MFLSNFLKRSFLGLFLFYTLLNILFLNPTYSTQIESIEIEGNTKTLDYIIKREISHNLLQPLDSLSAEKDRDRIENLGIFSEVTWKIIPLNADKVKLVYTVIESVQNLPPSILPIYDEKTGWSINGGLLFTNFRGRNQSLSFNLSIGGKDTYGFIFSDPWIIGDHISLRAEIDKSIYRHNFLDYNVEKNKVRIDFGKWFGQNIKTMIGLSVESINFKNDLSPVVLKSNYLSIKPTLKYDTRDIYWNPTRGVLWSNSLKINKGVNKREFSNLFWSQSVSTYHDLIKTNKKLIIAFNGTHNFFWGYRNKMWLNYLGDSFTVRGWPLPNQDTYNGKLNDFRFGYQSIYSSIELRKEIIPKSSTQYGTQFGLLVVLFIDAGSISYDILSLNENSKMIGSGIGIRIPLPLINLIRFDLGWGYRNGSWDKGILQWGISHKF